MLIQNTFVTVNLYALKLEKLLKNIPYRLIFKTGEVDIMCGCTAAICIVPKNWSISALPGHPKGNALRKQ